MHRLLFLLGIVFSLLTIIGAVYVISSGGKASAGFAVIPMVFAIALVSLRKK